MVAKVKEIANYLEEKIPPHLAESWDNTGLAIGDPEANVKKILLALDVTNAVIAEAIAMKADMILTHHPMLLFQKITDIRKDKPLGRRIYQLIENGISAYSAHTNLDVVQGGVNDVLAEVAGLTNVSILEETWAEELQKIVVYVPETHLDSVREAMAGAGAGNIGNYSHCSFGTVGEGTFLAKEGTDPFVGTVGELEKVPEIRLESIAPKEKMKAVLSAIQQAHPYEEVAYDIYAVEQKGKREGIGRIGELETSLSFSAFASILKEKLGLDGIRLVGDGEKEIKRVGVCGGAGVDFMALAKRKGADAYITADIKFHEAQRALEMDLAVIDATHYASEVLILPWLEKELKMMAKEKDWELEVVCSNISGQTFWTL